MAGPKKKAVNPAHQPTLQDQVRAQIVAWVNDPKSFYREALGVKLSNQQAEFVELVRDMIQSKEKRSLGEPMTARETELAGKIGISVHSGKGLGKDFVVAGLIPFFLICFKDFKGLATAPTSKQLEDVLSNEVKRVLRDSPVKLSELIEITRGGFYTKANNKRMESFVSKRTANLKGSDETGEVLSGMHAPYMVLIGDEASGLPDAVLNEFETTMTGFCNFAILIGNPTRNTGYFYKTHYDSKSRELWECVRWDAEKSDLETIRPGIKAQIERMERKYGREHNAFRVNVLGLPPKTTEDGLIPIEWIWDAVDRDIEPLDDDPTVFGVDIGRGGDDSVIYMRKGHRGYKIETLSVPDTAVVEDWVEVAIEEHEPDGVYIDLIGVGAGVHDNLRRRHGGLIDGVNASETPTYFEQCKNVRAEMYWRVRKLFEDRVISIPNDEELVFELSEIKVETWEPKLQLVSKKKMKSMGLQSPNKADAVVMSYYRYRDSKARATQRRERYKFSKRENSDNLGWMVA